jgi:DNA polymerase-1
MGEYIDQLRASVEVIAGHPINLNSPLQLGEFLFGELKLVEKPKKTKRGQYVTDEETLSALASRHPVINDILDYREASKLKSTYLDALPRYISPADGRIHTKFHQLLTATGRLASQDPNLQNIPIRSDQGKFIRQAFVPRSDEYVLLSADYSQIELRIMAALSGDPMMIEAFQENRDIHTETAAKVYGIPRDMVTPDMRRAAKTVNFGIIYGISAFGLSQRLGCSRREASDLVESYFAQFPGLKAYMDKLIAVATEKGYAETLCGRRRYLPDLQSANKNIRSAAERTAINTPIQGTAAEMIKLSMIHTHRLLLGKKSRLILQIHDELLVDLHRDELDLIDSIKAQMLNALPLPHNVPTIVEAKTGDNWLAAH